MICWDLRHLIVTVTVSRYVSMAMAWVELLKLEPALHSNLGVTLVIL